MPRDTDLTLGGAVRAQLYALCDWAGLPPPMRGQLVAIYDLLTQEAMNRPPIAPFDGLSFINANGLPFQWSLSLGSGPRTVRFLCEAGTPGETPVRRCEFSRERLAQACLILDIPWPQWLRESVFPHTLPRDGEWPSHWRSALWFGVGVSSRNVMLRPYFNLNRDTPLKRWHRVGWILKSLGRDGALRRLCDLSCQVSAESWPVGLAVDILPSGAPGRVKVYFRSGATSPDWLNRWYVAVGAKHESGSVRQLLDVFPYLEKRIYQPRSFIVSLEFHDDREVSLKTDLAIARWIPSDAEIAGGIRHLMAKLGLDESEFISALECISAWPPCPDEVRTLRFVGLGYEPDGSRHLNLYIEPPVNTRRIAKTAPAICTVHESVSAGLNYLLATHREQHWSDYSLPVGMSNRWVSAYVLLQLMGIPPSLLTGQAKQQIEKALDWLAQARTPGAGWGYNATTEDDADSTSLAILALRRHGRAVPREALEVVRQCFTREGGIATYRPGFVPQEAWMRAVPDITPLSLAALGDEISAIEKKAAEQFLKDAQLEDGIFPSFWWLSPLYATSAVLEWMPEEWDLPRKAVLSQTLASYHPLGAFETALLLLCRYHIGITEGSKSLVKSLLSEQQLNGSWKPSAYLRLTNPTVAHPWNNIDSGPIFIDQNASLTTATVLHALLKIADML